MATAQNLEKSTSETDDEDDDKLTITLSKDLKERLRIAAKKDDRPLSSLGRIIIAEGLAAREAAMDAPPLSES